MVAATPQIESSESENESWASSADRKAKRAFCAVHAWSERDYISAMHFEIRLFRTGADGLEGSPNWHVVTMPSDEVAKSFAERQLLASDDFDVVHVLRDGRLIHTYRRPKDAQGPKGERPTA